jgi:hypothetical protein
MDTPNRSFPHGELRVSDADRDRAVAELSEHFQSGRITQEEFEDRSGRALQARTGTELTALFSDLPQRHEPFAGMPPAAASAGRVGRGVRVPVAGIVIACVIASIVVGNVFSNVHHVHGSGFGWLVPVLILGFVFRRVACGRR